MGPSKPASSKEPRNHDVDDDDGQRESWARPIWSSHLNKYGQHGLVGRLVPLLFFCLPYSLELSLVFETEADWFMVLETPSSKTHDQLLVSLLAVLIDLAIFFCISWPFINRLGVKGVWMERLNPVLGVWSRVTEVYVQGLTPMIVSSGVVGCVNSFGSKWEGQSWAGLSINSLSHTNAVSFIKEDHALSL